jgi:hypothetical protein
VIKLSQNTSVLDFVIGKLIRAIGANPHMEQAHCDATNFVFPYQEFLALDADTFRLEREELVQYLPHFCYLRHLEAESWERGGEQDLLLALRQMAVFILDKDIVILQAIQ